MHTAAHLNLMNEYSGKMRDIMAGFPTFMRAQRNFSLWIETIKFSKSHYVEVSNLEDNAAS